ncbi:uncharacterized protein [Clytia hemisphaerica]|uniref:HECT domain-containing protein n=1 Tax=Clytia hemisphaerica TaxID=252671 RepID=A0A7M5UM95_9CNID
MQARQLKADAILEPSLEEDHIVIKIRHPSVGTKSRLFFNNSRMADVYHWVGSMSMDPEFFQIVDYDCKVHFPDSIATSGVYNVKPIEEAMNLSESGEVGFGEFLPAGNKVVCSKEELESLRKTERERLIDNGTNFEFVSRENIYNDMLKLYRKRGITTKNVVIEFNDESGEGDGVSRDVFAAFFAELYTKMDGDNEKIPTIDMDETDLEVIGKVITHAYLLHGLYPFKIAHCAMKFELFGNLDDEDLVRSFLNYLPANERKTINDFADGKVDSVQSIINILSEARCFQKPTSENIFRLCREAANRLLIKQPFFAFKTMVESMGLFWKKLTPEMFDNCLLSTKPCAKTIIKTLDPNEHCALDGKITTHLHRFIESVSEDELALFVRFTTGTSSLVEGEKLKVNFVEATYFAPKSSTCFKILTLPRMVMSFMRFRQEFLSVLNNKLSWRLHDD